VAGATRLQYVIRSLTRSARFPWWLAY